VGAEHVLLPARSSPMRDELFEAGSICSKPNSEYLVGSSEHLDTLLEIAEPVRSLRNAPREVVEATILLLCDGRYLTLENLADLLNRGKDSLRNHYINPMLESGRLETKYKNIRNHPRQGYRATPGTEIGGEV
jgi:ATP-dependent DNA helicase RecG